MAVANWVDWSLGVCLAKMGLVAAFLCRKTSKLAGELVGSVFAYLIPLFIVLVRNIFRLDDKSSCSSATPQPSSEVVSIDSVKYADTEVAEFFSDDSSEEDSPKLVFKFQSYEDFIRKKGENHDTHEPVTLSSFCKFLEESEDVKSDVKQTCEISKVENLESGEGFKDGFLSDKDLVHQSYKEECGQIDQTESKEDVLQKVEELETKLGSVEFCVEEKEEVEFSLKSASSESMVSEDELADISGADESITDGFLSDGDFMPYLEQCIDNEPSLDSLENDEECMENEDEDEAGALKELERLLKSQSKDWRVENETNHFHDEYEDMLQDLDSKNAEDILGSDFLSEDDFSCKQEMPDSEMDSNWEDEDEDLESLWEHQDILEQLSIEIKNARATGLPTIDEHTEISKFSENLKPWKIEEKFQPGDMFSMVHKFYRSYWEKMRKLDILSYQKMYAIGLLQSRDPLKSVSGSGDKSETPAFALFNSLWRNKNRKIEAEPMMKFIRELHNDLELVYVGQMCLSWDILHWQYEKALELWEADPHGLRRFNLVCSEFQQFQVLLQRFVEDERHQGPRVQSYVNCRRSLHNLLLQVPVIREDKKGKKMGSPSRDEPLSSDVLVEAMEESIRTFWKFLRADKQQPISKRVAQCELQDPADSELLSELIKTLQKKERQLKDVLRTGNCILRKFKRRLEDDHSDQVLCFFSQVDIRLVARVLRMSRLSKDQLQWCGNKLSSINFVNGRVHVEPSFSLFPC
ncbi:unnamed protein product [Rhodiola kirilowii]